jgi:hypothetical protein
MNDQTLQRIRASSVPLTVFLGGAAVVLAAIYWLPRPAPQIASVVGFLLAVGFVVYLRYVRKGDTASLGATFPTFLGPILAVKYVEHRGSQQLKDALAAGGEQLIQIAFFFAGLIGAIVYVFVLINDGHAQERKRLAMFYLAGLFALLIVMSLFDLTSPISTSKVIFATVLEAPALSVLTIGRIVI